MVTPTERLSREARVGVMEVIHECGSNEVGRAMTNCEKVTAMWSMSHEQCVNEVTANMCTARESKFLDITR